MDSDLIKAYDHLTPKDQQVADIVILSLYEKDIQVNRLTEQVREYLDSQKGRFQ